jgi:di/tricarboxylate transporter
MDRLTPLLRCIYTFASRNEVKWFSGPVLGVLSYGIISAQSPQSDPKIRGTIGICVWMVMWWLTEVVGMGITGLLPMVFLPLLGILESEDVSSVYFSDTVVVCWGSVIMTAAIEKYNLHKIFADYFLKARLTTLSPRRLLLGFVVCTGFLSMWMSNTATAALVCPLAKAVIGELQIIEMQRQSEGLAPRVCLKSLATATDLAIAYAASLGGMATLTGTGANLVLQGTMNSMFGQNVGISFLGWLMIAGPIAWVDLFLLWIILCTMYLSRPPTSWRSNDGTNTSSRGSIELTTINVLTASSSSVADDADGGVSGHHRRHSQQEQAPHLDPSTDDVNSLTYPAWVVVST